MGYDLCLVPLCLSPSSPCSALCCFSSCSVNKSVFRTYSFNFPIALTALHFVLTFLGLAICALFGVFSVKPAPLKDVLPLSLTFTGFVVFNNLSLQYNSLGTYQLFKVLTTPAIVLIQIVAFAVTTHSK